MSEAETTAIALLVVTSPITILLAVWGIRLLANSRSVRQSVFLNSNQIHLSPEGLKCLRAHGSHLSLVKRDEQESPSEEVACTDSRDSHANFNS